MTSGTAGCFPGPEDVDVVIPTVGRPSLAALLKTLAGPTALPRRIILVDDRGNGTSASPVAPAVPPAALISRIEVVRSGGRGPASARNAGWRHAAAPWIAFLDDDVLAPEGWFSALLQDLQEAPDDVAGSQGRIEVPLPADRRPTDWERNVAGLERARWATADMAYRREVLDQVGGFDERFPRAYREDADLALRVHRAGYRTVRGGRRIVHPVRPTDDGVSLRLQAGNADDPLMRALHGRGWRRVAHVPHGRRPWHLATVASGLTFVAGAVARRPRISLVALAAWAALTGDFAWRRIAPGPRDADEVRRMIATSIVLPFLAVWHWLRGLLGLRRRLRQAGPRTRLPAAVIFDRDGTLIHDVPYNGDPSAVRTLDGARQALERLRSLRVPTAVVSNQSGIGRGTLTAGQVDAVNRRVEQLLGPMGPWEICPHAPEDGCGCRKPSPTLILRVCHQLGVDPRACVMIGDIGADIDAAHAAGAHAVLIPTPQTRPDEVAAAPLVARDVGEAVDLALRCTSTPTGPSTPTPEGGV